MTRRVLRAVGIGVTVIAVLTLIALMTRGSALQSDMVFNRDEGELLAEARRGVLGVAPFGTYRTSTHLFLWPLFLSALAHLGMPLTLQSAHVLSVALTLAMVLAAWWVVARTWGWRLSALFLLPGALFYLGQSWPDYRSLSTEQLGLALLALAAAVGLGRDGTPSLRRLLAVSLLAGTAVWTKPQVGPLAVSVVIVTVLVGLLDPDRASAARPTRQVAVGIAGLLLPTVAFLAWILVSGTWDRFVDETVMVQWNYLGIHDPEVGEQPGLAARLPDVARVFLRLPGWLWALVGLVGWSGWQAGRRTVVLATVAWATPLAAAFASLVVTYPIYSHYEGLVLLAGLLSAMVGASAHRAVCGYSRAAIRTARTATLGFGFVGLLLFIASLDATAAYLPGKATRTDPEPAATSVSTACPRGSTVLVWGWAPELYSYYDWVPASRYVITNVLIRPYAKPDGMERILTSELLESPPDCIVEDVGPGSFGAFGPGSGLVDRMPSTAAALTSCYTQAEASVRGDREVHVWKRNPECAAGAPLR